MPRNNDLGADPLGPLILRLAVPSMLAQLVNVLYSIVDRMYIGNISGGDLALAGVGVCGPIVTLISSFAFLVGIGGAPLLAIRLGEEDEKGARQILANSALMLTVLAAVLTIAALLLRDRALLTFGASTATYPYARDYYTIYVLGAFFNILSIGLNQFIICQGFSTIGMATVVIGAALNIILDPVFIFVFHMGVKGAALATVLSQAASFAFVLLVLLGRQVRVRLTAGGYSFALMRRILLFGFSPFVIVATDSVLILVLNSVLQRYGGPEKGDMFITCATIVQSYMQLITMPMAGITGGTQSVLSYNYGAKNIVRIKEAYRHIFRLCLIFAGVMFLISQFASRYFVMIFTGEQELSQMAVWGIRVFTLGVIPLALQYEVVDGFTALGIAKAAISLSLNRKILYLLLTLILPVFYGAKGAFYAEPAVDIFCGVLSMCVYFPLIRRVLKKRENMPDGAALYR